MSALDCPLTDAALIEAVTTMNAELARTGAKTWRMHIPVDLRRDSDILIAEVARRFRDQQTDLLDALGWQGGTVAQALEEVRRLKAQSVAPGQASLIDAFVKGAKWWEFHSTGGTMWQSDQHKAHDAGRRKYPDPPLGQGVAALLPEHGEVKP